MKLLCGQTVSIGLGHHPLDSFAYPPGKRRMKGCEGAQELCGLVPNVSSQRFICAFSCQYGLETLFSDFFCEQKNAVVGHVHDGNFCGQDGLRQSTKKVFSRWEKQVKGDLNNQYNDLSRRSHMLE